MCELRKFECGWKGNTATHAKMQKCKKGKWKNGANWPNKTKEARVAKRGNRDTMKQNEQTGATIAKGATGQKMQTGANGYKRVQTDANGATGTNNAKKCKYITISSRN